MPEHSATAMQWGDEDRVKKRIADYYGRVLKIDVVTDNDDFFVLGGHSLSAMELLDLIDDELGVRLDPTVLYHATVVSELAREVTARMAGQPEGA